MQKLFALGVLLSLSTGVSAQTQATDTPQRPELELKRLLIGTTDHEISGIDMDGKRIRIVADAPDDTYLYVMIEDGLRFHVKKDLNLTSLAGAKAYLEELKKTDSVAEKDRRFDLEGMTRCDKTQYLINERVRHVLVIENDKSLKKLPIDFLGAYPDLMKGGANAGFEGIAADCANKILYVAKERDPRAIFKVEMDTWKILAVKDFPESNRGGQKVINFFTGDGLFDIGPDIGDLFFENGHLYVLERNTWEIAKLKADDLSVVSRVSYYRTEKDLYQTGEPFGIAESLFLKGDEIWVGVDNNRSPLSVLAERQHQVRGNFPSFFVLKRPAGF